MEKATIYENYPCGTVLVSNAVSIAIYIAGSYIIYQLGLAWMLLYWLYIIVLEFRLLKNSCTKCYYFGKRCAFGKGKIAALFFKKDSRPLGTKKITWADILPDFLVSIIPILVGIGLLVLNFNWAILCLIIVLFILMSAGNGFVRSQLACKHCKQRELGCPAEQLFGKKATVK